MQFAPGSVLGSYRILRPLGEGGMGRVYEAEHMALKVRRAVKVFSAESEHADFLRRRFVAEGRILADLQHPRIVRVYDFAIDAESGVPYFAMDLVVSPTGEPRTLEDACRDGIDEQQVASWFRDVCEGLDYIHSKSVVHRDISLDNILLDPDGHAVLTDFGIAKITGEAYRRKIELTMTMAAMAGEKFRLGKGLYMAPELKDGATATPASDAYAVGVLLFRILAGSWYTPHARLEDSLAGMDYNWPTVIRRLCAESPDGRLAEDGMLGAFSLLRSVVPPPRRRVGRLASVLLLLLSATIALLLLLMMRKGKSSMPSDAERAPITQNTDINTPVYHIIEVTNYVHVPEKVYHVVTYTNLVNKLKQ